MPYSDSFKLKMVQRMMGPHALSATELSRQVGIPQPTLSTWLRESRSLVPMKQPAPDKPDVKSPRQWSAEEKLRVVLAAASVSGEDFGAFLRREGLHESDLLQWRAVVLAAARAALDLSKPKNPPGAAAGARKVKELEREIRRKDKALAEVTALLVLSKKVTEIWGAGDDSTEGKTAK